MLALLALLLFVIVALWLVGALFNVVGYVLPGGPAGLLALAFVAVVLYWILGPV